MIYWTTSILLLCKKNIFISSGIFQVVKAYMCFVSWINQLWVSYRILLFQTVLVKRLTHCQIFRLLILLFQHYPIQNRTLSVRHPMFSSLLFFFKFILSKNKINKFNVYINQNIIVLFPVHIVIPPTTF